jgi:hypothetical protein
VCVEYLQNGLKPFWNGHPFPFISQFSHILCLAVKLKLRNCLRPKREIKDPNGNRWDPRREDWDPIVLCPKSLNKKMKKTLQYQYQPNLRGHPHMMSR